MDRRERKRIISFHVLVWLNKKKNTKHEKTGLKDNFDRKQREKRKDWKTKGKLVDGSRQNGEHEHMTVRRCRQQNEVSVWQIGFWDVCLKFYYNLL